MATGKRLFEGATPPSVMRAHFQPLALPAGWPEGVPTGLDNILGVTLTKAPGNRYARAGELAEAVAGLAVNRLAEPYTALQAAIAASNWPQALALAGQIRAEKPDYQDVIALEAQALAGQERAARAEGAAAWRAETERALAEGDRSGATLAARQWAKLTPDDPALAALRAKLEARQAPPAKSPAADAGEVEQPCVIAPAGMAARSRRLTLAAGGIALLALVLALWHPWSGSAPRTPTPSPIPESADAPLTQSPAAPIAEPTLRYDPVPTPQPTNPPPAPTIVQPIGLTWSERTNRDTPSASLQVEYSDGSKRLIVENVMGGAVNKECDRILFEQYTDTNGDGQVTFDDISEIYVSSIDGSNKRRLTTDLAHSDQASWSPDATEIVYRSERSGTGEVWIVASDGGSSFQLTREANWAGHVSWSPDGRFIAFYTSDNAGSYATLIKPDGTGLRRVSGYVGNGWGLFWTIDGQLVFPVEIETDKRHWFMFDLNNETLTDITGTTIQSRDQTKCGWPVKQTVMKAW